MHMIELFSGRATMSQAFKNHGFTTFTYDWNEALEPDFAIDINELTDSDMKGAHVIWASPDCTKFSFASGSKNEFRKANTQPFSEEALFAIKTVKKTIELCKNAEWYWFIENPDHGALKEQSYMKSLPMTTVAYCNYGVPHQKYTNIWGQFPPSWKPRGHCGHRTHPNIKQHSDAQGRAIIPPELCEQIAKACVKDMGQQIPTLDRWCS